MLAAGVLSKRPAPPAFLELIAPEANRVAEYTIELEGGTLRIHCKGATVMEFADLSRALQSAIR
jgi:hypothetical protein